MIIRPCTHRTFVIVSLDQIIFVHEEKPITDPTVGTVTGRVGFDLSGRSGVLRDICVFMLKDLIIYLCNKKELPFYPLF
jgi:hypothetical protein